MPRYSARRTAIRELEATIASREEAAMQRFFFNEEDELEKVMDKHVRAHLEHIKATRYFVRQSTYRKRPDRWQILLNDTDYLNDREYFRVTRTAFRRIVNLNKDDDALQAGPRRTFRGPVELHLMVLHKYLGS